MPRVSLHNNDPMGPRQLSPKFIGRNQAPDAATEDYNGFGTHALLFLASRLQVRYRQLMREALDSTHWQVPLPFAPRASRAS